MKYIILNKSELEELSKNPFPKSTGIISIRSADEESIKLQYSPDFLLQLSFNDSDNNILSENLGNTPTEFERIYFEQGNNLMTDLQANQLVDFYLTIKNQITTLICQSENGKSRSSAVIAAILEYQNKQGVQIFSDDRYNPNKTVFRKIYNSLINKGYNCLFSL